MHEVPVGEARIQPRITKLAQNVTNIAETQKGKLFVLRVSWLSFKWFGDFLFFVQVFDNLVG